MATKEKMNSIQKTARVAGFLTVLVLATAFFSSTVRSNPVVPGNATETANNIWLLSSYFVSVLPPT